MERSRSIDNKHKITNRVEEKQAAWGSVPADNFGYADTHARHEQRGLEDWEMVEDVQKPDKRIPKWVYGGILGIVLMAFALSLPFWGDRPGHERPWITAGHLYALLYFLVAAGVIYFMTKLYGSGSARTTSFEDDDIEMPSHSTKGDS